MSKRTAKGFTEDHRRYGKRRKQGWQSESDDEGEEERSDGIDFSHLKTLLEQGAPTMAEIERLTKLADAERKEKYDAAISKFSKDDLEVWRQVAPCVIEKYHEKGSLNACSCYFNIDTMSLESLLPSKREERGAWFEHVQNTLIHESDIRAATRELFNNGPRFSFSFARFISLLSSDFMTEEDLQRGEYDEALERGWRYFEERGCSRDQEHYFLVAILANLLLENHSSLQQCDCDTIQPLCLGKPIRDWVQAVWALGTWTRWFEIHWAQNSKTISDAAGSVTSSEKTRDEVRSALQRHSFSGDGVKYLADEQGEWWGLGGS